MAETGEFAGFTGLWIPRFDAPFMPAVEIGWRLARGAWGRGIASEAARASMAHAFDALQLDEVVAMIVPDNLRSQAVATPLGMVRDESPPSSALSTSSSSSSAAPAWPPSWSGTGLPSTP